MVHPRDYLGDTAAVTRGVVAAGHLVTAEAGASALPKLRRTGILALLDGWCVSEEVGDVGCLGE